MLAGGQQEILAATIAVLDSVWTSARFAGAKARNILNDLRHPSATLRASYVNSCPDTCLGAAVQIDYETALMTAALKMSYKLEFIATCGG